MASNKLASHSQHSIDGHPSVTCSKRNFVVRSNKQLYKHIKSPPLSSQFLPPMNDIRSRSPSKSLHRRAINEDAPSPSIQNQQEKKRSFDIERTSLLPSSSSSAPPPPPQRKPEIDWSITSLIFLFPALGGLLFGYDIGATSGALLSMTSPSLSGTDWYDLTAFTSGLVVSLSLGGALAGSVAALVYGDRLGRKKELILASALYATGASLVAVAPTLPVVLTGRLLYGVGIGFAMHAAPAYIAETSPASVRGLLISLKEAFIVGGILCGYLVSYLGVDVLGGWRWMYGASIPLACVLALGMSWLPESPRWLLLSSSSVPDNDVEEISSSSSPSSLVDGESIAAAVDALYRVKGKVATERSVQDEVDEILATIMESRRGEKKGNASSSSFDISQVLAPQYRRPLTIGVSLMLFQQITGQPSVLYYAAKIFQSAGFSSAGAATAISVVLGFFKLIMTGVAVATVDSWGRRPLLLTGISGIIISLLILGSSQSGMLPLSADVTSWVSVGALLLYVGAYQCSFGPISWLIVGEVFPLRVRGNAIALATLTNFASNFGVSLVLPTLQEKYGPSAMYFGFAVIGVWALVTINSIVPETKGKSLEDIEKLWVPSSLEE